MGIVGLTDNGNAGFPRLGKLRKGEKKVQENRPGKDLPDFWRFTSEQPGILEAFESAYGIQPNNVTVFLPYPDMDRNWTTCKEKWTTGAVLGHRCDGEWCSRWVDLDTGEYINAGDPGVKPMPCPGECQEVGRLEVILPALVEAGFVGTVTAETHSINDIVNLQKALRAGEMIVTQWGWRISQVPWLLYRTTQTIGRPRSAKERKTMTSLRSTTDKSLVFIAPDSDWMSVQVKALQEHARTQVAAPDMLQIEENAQSAREVAMPATPAQVGDDLMLPETQGRVVDTETGEILSESEEIVEGDVVETPNELDPWDVASIPGLETKEAFWEWAQKEFPNMAQADLGDACKTVTLESTNYTEAAAMLKKQIG